MRRIFARHTRLILGGIALCCVGALAYYLFLYTPEDTRERARVERGTVEEIVSVSGSVRTRNTSDLSFAGTGIVSEIMVREGAEVTEGQVLATLAQAGPLAEYNDALAILTKEQATLDELVVGPRNEERRITDSALAIARADLERVTRIENEKVVNARRALYSSDLIARPARITNDDTPPTISGSYTCSESTQYRFETYSSGARSGYSYRITAGDGTSSDTATSESATPFSTCGLYIQFAEDETYGQQEWIIDVPNTKGASYTTNLNAFALAQKNRDNAINEATQALEKAEREALLENAPPRPEALTRAQAAVQSARARLQNAEARIADYTIRAPFDGIVTNVSLAHGEASTGGVITMTARDSFELKIRVPEIDITQIRSGDHARASFDAKPDAMVYGTVSFVSPVPQEIDGVAYFEAYIALSEVPDWMRTGLNADVDVTIERAEDVLRLPRRFVREENGSFSILTKIDGTDVSTPVAVGLIGNDGYIEVRDVKEGIEVIAP